MGEWGTYSSRRGRRLQETGAHCIMNIFMICALHQGYSGDEVKEDETAGPEVLRRKSKMHTGI
jgi:hypothetical protein